MTYRISERSQTEIHANGGRPSATACMQLSIPAPSCDRMIAEYLILKNDEALYWKIANVFPLERNASDSSLLLFMLLDLGLILNLLWIVNQIIR